MYKAFKDLEVNNEVGRVIFNTSRDLALAICKLQSAYDKGLVPTLYFYKSINGIEPNESDKRILIDILKIKQANNACGYFITY